MYKGVLERAVRSAFDSYETKREREKKKKFLFYLEVQRNVFQYIRARTNTPGWIFNSGKIHFNCAFAIVFAT